MKKILKILIALLLVIVAVFGVAGCNASTQSKIDELQSRIDEMNEKLADMEEQLKEKDERIEQLEKVLGDKIAYNKAGKFYEQEVDELVELNLWFFTSGVRNNNIVFRYEDKNAIIQCSVDNGYFDDEKSISVAPDVTLYWSARSISVEQAYMQAIIKSDNNIVGYILLEIVQLHETFSYSAFVLKSALFPLIGGTSQNITEEQVERAIERIKAENIKPIEEEGTDFIQMKATNFTQNEKDNALTFDYSNDKVVIECFTNRGEFKTEEESGNGITVKAGETFYWVPPEPYELKGQIVKFAFIVKEEGNIVGYAIYSLFEEQITTGGYRLLFHASIVFPKVDGAYPKVDETKLKNYINKYSLYGDII